MSTLLWNLILPALIVLSTATPGAGWYYVEPIDDAVEVSALYNSGPLVAGTLLDYLPDGARSVMIENTQYFISSGNWFVAVVGGDIQYMVVLAPV